MEDAERTARSQSQDRPGEYRILENCPLEARDQEFTERGRLDASGG